MGIICCQDRILQIYYIRFIGIIRKSYMTNPSIRVKIILLLFVLYSVNANAQSPNFKWAKSIGSAGEDIGYSINLDANGNVITKGTIHPDTIDFDPGLGVFNIITNGGGHLF